MIQFESFVHGRESFTSIIKRKWNRKNLEALCVLVSVNVILHPLAIRKEIFIGVRRSNTYSSISVRTRNPVASSRVSVADVNGWKFCESSGIN